MISFDPLHWSYSRSLSILLDMSIIHGDLRCALARALTAMIHRSVIGVAERSPSKPWPPDPSEQHGLMETAVALAPPPIAPRHVMLPDGH